MGRRAWAKVNAAPLLREVGVKYEVKKFNGSFLDENIYRKIGTPEVDKAWDDLGVNCTSPCPRKRRLC